ncbi:hypothetical protein EJ110_NYTH05977 [Nymphaea thermarum]|nr:hypothetical protein EJ110_NYTH05977 [Nymphaea thermarum]
MEFLLDAPDGCMERKNASSGAFLRENDPLHGQLTVITNVPAETSDSERLTAAIWPVSPERLENPRRSFHQSNGSDSPCASESGSDLLSKREVVYKLRQQLKKRDEMILEMQGQITEQQKLVNEHIIHDVDLQSQLDAANRALFSAEREIQRLRKVIADFCASGYSRLPDDQVASGNGEVQKNGYVNGVVGELEAGGWHGVGMLMIEGQGEADRKRAIMFKKEAEELKEVMKEKDCLLQSYKEQKMELCSRVKELQLRLDSQRSTMQEGRMHRISSSTDPPPAAVATPHWAADSGGTTSR